MVRDVGRMTEGRLGSWEVDIYNIRVFFMCFKIGRLNYYCNLIDYKK